MIFRMQFEGHEPHHRPHIHVKFGEYEISIAIDNIEAIAGYLPAKKLKKALDYIENHQGALLEQWNKAVNGEPVRMIEP
ncbi:DUF4160 domain-containing protein [Vibrio sp. SCSIO 43137]|nr:DUF4160 domain-containing protein [Vibrio sp. SCSIO 43137]WCE32657.1 DUF4160 domain-containing protein [Vibrio sp. SCSIO 43137]